MVKKIHFSISPDGEVNVNVDCVQGNECEILTRPFEEKIGTVFSKSYKDSFYVETSNQENSTETQDSPKDHLKQSHS